MEWRIWTRVKLIYRVIRSSAYVVEKVLPLRTGHIISDQQRGFTERSGNVPSTAILMTACWLGLPLYVRSRNNTDFSAGGMLH